MRVACCGSKRPRFQRLPMERVAGHGVQLHPWDRLDNVILCLVFPHCVIAGLLPGGALFTIFERSGADCLYYHYIRKDYVPDIAMPRRHRQDYQGAVK